MLINYLNYFDTIKDVFNSYNFNISYGLWGFSNWLRCMIFVILNWRNNNINIRDGLPIVYNRFGGTLDYDIHGDPLTYYIECIEVADKWYIPGYNINKRLEIC